MPVTSEIKPALEPAVRALERAGARLHPGWPSGFSFREMFSTCLAMPIAYNFSIAPPGEQAKRRAELAARKEDENARASLIDFASRHRHNLRRIAFRAAWQRYFQNMDAFPLPVLPVPAFPHDPTEKASQKLETPEGPQP